ncbi:MAG TPA: hypothetical protein EYO33_07370 [Phycisphaerales bacterium]|nr:hypothetical protein [Phycisphaerales bacterium]
MEKNSSMRKIPIDLEELVDQANWTDEMELGPLRVFDLETGKIVWVERELANALDSEEDLSVYGDPEEIELARRVMTEDRFVSLPERLPDENFQIMKNFVRHHTSGDISKTLEDALKKRRPFRSFKDALYDFPEVQNHYFKFEAECHRQWIVDWLHSLQIEPIDTGHESPG